MTRGNEFYTLVDSPFYEPIERLDIGTEYLDLVKDLLPNGWQFERSGVWAVAADPRMELVEQGFKIHISATQATARAILETVVPICVEQNISFKLIADERLLFLVNSKNYGRGASGKFFVIYPPKLDIFKSLCRLLAEVTAHLQGPYILSDRRYPGGSVVYYRYGGFRRMELLGLDGFRTACIRDPSSILVPDRRQAVFELPPWVQDPFPQEVEKNAGSGLLNERYEVMEALSFSNTGGVYKALDHKSDKKSTVILKEARPLTGYWANDVDNVSVDATRTLRKEYDSLLRLAKHRVCPQPLDFFKEWEHTFLVEEFFEGTTLAKYRASGDRVILGHAFDEDRLLSFCEFFKRTALDLESLVRTCHSEGLIIGDLSPYNLIVNVETGSMVLIDLETVIDSTAPQATDKYYSRMFTPGFRHPSRQVIDFVTELDDWFAVSRILTSLIVPIEAFFTVRREAEADFQEAFGETLGLPVEVFNTIRSFQVGNADEAIEIMSQWNLEKSVASACRASSQQVKSRVGRSGKIRSDVEGVMVEILEAFETNITLDREASLWPGDINLLTTNPLSLAYGACGPLMLLQLCNREVSPAVRDWVAGVELSMDVIPPGLYVGTAGIAWVMMELGWLDIFAKAWSATVSSPLKSPSSDYLWGAAGWGLTALQLYQKTSDSVFLDQAKKAGSGILQRAREGENGGLYWVNTQDEEVHCGLAHGASGIALFLLRLYEMTQDDSFLQAGKEALRFEFSSVEDPDASRLRWPNFIGAKEAFEPYWYHGSAGIAAVFARYAEALDDDFYLDVALRAGEYAHNRFTVQPSYFEGLAGIGDTNLDLFNVTGNEEYLDKALDVVESILLYKVPLGEKACCFPGRRLIKLSMDLSTGSTGIGLFFNRFLNSGSRRQFMDIDPVKAESVAKS